jgi:small subunit ribosomal protein S1
VHISELAQHHVENPREVVSQGDTVNVRILEVDAERRRLSLSLKRVEEGMPVQPKPGDEALPPAIDLSENVFADEALPAVVNEPAAGDEAPVESEAAAEVEPEAEAEAAEPEAAIEAAEPEAAEPEAAAPEAAAPEAAAPEAAAPEAAAESGDEPAEGSDDNAPPAEEA